MSITPELYEFIVKVVEEKVREIRVTREEFEKLRAAVEENTRAIAQLSEAIERLATAVGDLRMQVGRLSEVVGFSLEDIAKALVPYWLKEVHGVTLEGDLRREFLTLEDREVEIDLYSRGLKQGRIVDVVGETKSRIYGGDVLKFHREVVEPLRKLGREVVAFMVGFVVHPSAKREAEERGTWL